MILITGGAGYIGSHCVLEFIKDHNVVVFDNFLTGNIETIEVLKNISSNIEFFEGDLKNIHDIKRVFEKYNFEAVIHFAGLSSVEDSFLEEKKYFENNVLGTKNLLDVMIQQNVLKFIFSSSAAIFGEPKYLPIDEKHPENPINPYGKTKLEIEKLLKEYDKKYNLKSISLRYFNVIGGDNFLRIGEKHKNETHLIPNILKSVILNEKIKIYGNDYQTKDKTAIRDYIDVSDLILAHRLAFEYLKKNNKTDNFNLGSQKGYSIKEIISTIEDIIKVKVNFEYYPKRQGDVAILIADSKKIEKVLGWKPEKTLFESIKTSFEWQKKII